MTQTTTPPDLGARIAAEYGIKRSPHWDATKKAFLEQNPFCVACGAERQQKAGLQVHHREPFHYCILAGRPDLELDARNLITLCETESGNPTEDHHLLLGHLEDFQSYNPSVWEQATGTYLGRTRADILADAAYQAALKNRPKKWSAMSDAERTAYRAYLDTTFPRR